jgi:hypothetical protein
MTTMKQVVKSMTLVGMGLALAAGAAYAQTPPPPDPCLVSDNGTGTVTLPPAGCTYLSADQVHLIIDGLPPGTTIILGARHLDFLCRKLGQCGTPGGPLGGEVEDFNSTAVFQLSGTGALAGWTRTISVPLAVQTATAPRTPGAPVQSFKTDMLRIQGSIGNDPDFDLFEVKGGTSNGFSSPGTTTLTRQGTSNLFRVDSSFNVGYAISFRGAPGGKLAGLAGTTTGTVTMTAMKPCTDAANCPCR